MLSSAVNATAENKRDRTSPTDPELRPQAGYAVRPAQPDGTVAFDNAPTSGSSAQR
jgi:hypothetical protein